jgi:hypothetical protein
MNAHPTLISRAIEPGDRIPQRRRRDFGEKIALAAEFSCCMPHINRDGLRWTPTPLVDFRCGQTRRRNRHLCNSADGKRRWQRRIAPVQAHIV